MSYILDALRRAEEQRSRGQLPGLHEVAAGGGAMLASPPATAPQRLLPLMLLLLMGGALAIGWILLREPTAVVAPPARPAVAIDTAASAAADVAAGDGQIASAPATDDAEPLLALPRDAVLVKEQAAVSVAPPKPASAETATPAEPPAAATQPAATVAALPNRQQLPQEIQRDLPQISVSGAVYSADPSQRMLVINGELWREGDQIRPDLILEEIRRHDAVLRFRGVSFTVSP